MEGTSEFDTLPIKDKFEACKLSVPGRDGAELRYRLGTRQILFRTGGGGFDLYHLWKPLEAMTEADLAARFPEGGTVEAEQAHFKQMWILAQQAAIQADSQ